jgi:hypothetical protein
VHVSKLEIEKHLACEQAYINTKNPEFMEKISEALKQCEKPENIGQERYQLKMMSL